MPTGQPQREPEPQAQRCEHRADGHANGDPLPSAYQTLVQLVADDEHEQHEADVGQSGQRRTHVDREEPVADQGAEQARPDQDPGEDLAHHGRLADPLGERAEAAGQHDDDGQAE